MGACQYTLFDVEGVEIHSIHGIEKIKAMSKIHYTDFNALNAMYAKDVKDGVCGFYAQHCIQSNVTHVEGVKCYVLYSVYRDLSLLQGGRLFEKPSILWV